MIQKQLLKYDTTIRRRAYFFIKESSMFTQNSIGKFSVLPNLRTKNLTDTISIIMGTSFGM